MRLKIASQLARGGRGAAAFLGSLQRRRSACRTTRSSGGFDGMPRPVGVAGLACALRALAAWWALPRLSLQQSHGVLIGADIVRHICRTMGHHRNGIFTQR
jgi:hypothetical protein